MLTVAVVDTYKASIMLTNACLDQTFFCSFSFFVALRADRKRLFELTDNEKCVSVFSVFSLSFIITLRLFVCRRIFANCPDFDLNRPTAAPCVLKIIQCELKFAQKPLKSLGKFVIRKVARAHGFLMNAINFAFIVRSCWCMCAACFDGWSIFCCKVL